MRTLLQIDEMDSGRLRFRSDCPPIISQFFNHIEDLALKLRRADTEVQIWIGLFGIAQQMLDLGIVRPPYDENEDYYPYDDDDFWFQDDSGADMTPLPKAVPVYNPEMDPEWQKKRLALREELCAWRKEKAEKWGVNNYDIIKHTVLDAISRAMPLTTRELLAVRGVGDLTVARHGEDILSIVQKTMKTMADEPADGVGGPPGGSDSSTDGAGANPDGAGPSLLGTGRIFAEDPAPTEVTE